MGFEECIKQNEKIRMESTNLPYIISFTIQADGCLIDGTPIAEEMLTLRRVHPIKIWGGCCGTDNRHMECLAKRL